MKLYIVTRADLKPGLQLAQSVHAARQFAAEYPELEKEWFEKSNTIVCLSIKNEQELGGVVDKAFDKGIKLSRFFEPDLENQLTAIALEPSKKSQELCRELPLAFQELETCDDNWY